MQMSMFDDDGHVALSPVATASAAAFNAQKEKTEPFTEEQVDALMVDVLDNGNLLDDAASVLKAFKNAVERGLTTVNEVVKAAIEEVLWLFSLYEEPSPVSFDAACAAAGMDSENVLAMFSRKFGNEIRMVHEYVCGRLPEMRERFVKRLSPYVCGVH